MMDRGGHNIMDGVHYIMDRVHHMMDGVHHMMNRIYYVMVFEVGKEINNLVSSNMSCLTSFIHKVFTRIHKCVSNFISK